jgi:hypothetical protein
VARFLLLVGMLAASTAVGLTVVRVASPAPSRPAARLVTCKSGYGLANGIAGMRGLPLVSAGPSVPGFAYFSDATRRLQPVLAPAGWHCRVELANDGVVLLLVSPKPIPSNDLMLIGGATIRARAPLILFYSSSICSGCIYGAACGAIAQVAKWRGFGPCGEDPARQATDVTELRKSGKHVIGEAVSFSDPPGVTGIGQTSGGKYAAVGAVLYAAYRRTFFDEASLETCALPARMADICSTVTAAFVRDHWRLPTL